jgi:NDP-sugar pyrophosphorylase family protein
MKQLKQCLILAGGLGTRLKPLTNNIPKPMIPVGDKPFLELQMQYLISQGICHFILAVGYKRDKIIEYFGSGEKWQIKIDYAIEKELLGTGGAIKNAENFLEESFLVVNGDTYLEVNLQACVKQYYAKGLPILMVLKEVADVSRYGSVQLTNTDIVEKFTEKNLTTAKGLINAGCYVLSQDVLNAIPSNQKTSIETDIFPKFVGKISGYRTKAHFIDIGTFDSYQTFKKEFRYLSQCHK